MQLLIFFLICLYPFPCVPAQDDAINMDIYTLETEEGYEIVVDNREPVPITVEVRLMLENMVSDRGDTVIAVVAGRTVGHSVAMVTVDDETMGYGIQVGTRTYYGNISSTPDEDHVYELPFAPGTGQRVDQGYNGHFSHRGKNALDFNMRSGTPIHAARGGVVAAVEESHNRSCNRPECMDFNNYIHIYHEDGTIADYAHLKQNGAVVKVGQRVRAGALIGYSGGTGYVSGPHLHFTVYQPAQGGRKTLRTRFRTARGVRFLEEGGSYRRPR